MNEAQCQCSGSYVLVLLALSEDWLVSGCGSVAVGVCLTLGWELPINIEQITAQMYRNGAKISPRKPWELSLVLMLDAGRDEAWKRRKTQVRKRTLTQEVIVHDPVVLFSRVQAFRLHGHRYTLYFFTEFGHSF
jgi:hypothetical protein